MAANKIESSKLEHMCANKFLQAKKCKTCEICGRMCHSYGKGCFNQKNFYKWVKLLKES